MDLAMYSPQGLQYGFVSAPVQPVLIPYVEGIEHSPETMTAPIWPVAFFPACQPFLLDASVAAPTAEVGPAGGKQRGARRRGGKNKDKGQANVTRTSSWQGSTGATVGSPTALHTSESAPAIFGGDDNKLELGLGVEAGPCEQFTDVVELGEDQDKCKQLVAMLDAAGPDEKHQMIDGLLLVAQNLSLSRHGCRIVQKVLEVAGSQDRDRLIASLAPHAVELYESAYGNYVLTKIVETAPGVAVKSIIDQLVAKGPSCVAKHQFGCRVLERLIEHCHEREIGTLLDQIVADSEALSRQKFGNFVIQHLLEHGTSTRRTAVIRRLNGRMSYLAMHKTASHVVQRALDHGDMETRNAIVEELLQAERPNSFIDIACSRFGKFVTEQLADYAEHSQHYPEVQRRLMESLHVLCESQDGKRVAERFGLLSSAP